MEGCRQKDEWSEGWMGGALAWHQSQLRIGCCPSNGTSDLIYPLAHPLPYAHSRVVLFSHTHFPHHSCACERRLSCAPFPLTSVLQVSPPPHGAGESQSASAFSFCCAVGTVSPHIDMQFFSGQIVKIKASQDCTDVHLY